jgi:hypothetical protein
MQHIYETSLMRNTSIQELPNIGAQVAVLDQYIIIPNKPHQSFDLPHLISTKKYY